MDADQTMRQRALELAKDVCDSLGDYEDMLTIANDYYNFIKFGTVPKPPEADDE